METLKRKKKFDTIKDEMVGGWSTFNCEIDKTALKAFKEAMEGFVGVTYEPFAVANQVVAGINYRFFCNAEMVVRYPANYCAMVTIFKPLKEKAVLKAIEPIGLYN